MNARRPHVATILAVSIALAGGCTRSQPDSDNASDTTDVASSETVVDDGLDGLVVVADAGIDADAVGRYVPSDAQLAELEASGAPDRFTVRFLASSTSTVPMRQEIWHYDASGTTLTYLDGAVYREERDGPVVELDGLATTPYRPEMITAAMSVDELLAVTGQSGYARQAVDQAIADAGELVVIEGAVAGFEAGELVAFETIPIAPTGP